MAKEREEKVFNFTRFDGGYFTNLSDAEMEDHELLTAENCYWDGGLEKRRGIQIYATVTASITIRGAARVYMAGAWRTIVAKDLGSSTVLHHQATASNAWASVDMPGGSAFSLVTGFDTHFATLHERLVGVNGTDEPWMVYETSAGSICADTIERYDTRFREDDNWAAGQLSSAGGTYTDASTAAKDTTAADFVLMTTTASTGFFIGCDFTFNRAVFTNVTVTGSIPFVFQYHGYSTYDCYRRLASATWITIGTASMIQTTSWATSTNSLTLEWPVPFVTEGDQTALAMEKLGDMGSADTFLGGKYAVQCYFTGTPSATGACDLVAVGHTQYLSELLLDDKPNTVASHKNQIILGMGNWVRTSPVNTLRGWRYDDYEYFDSGGSIQALVPHGDYLAVLQEDACQGLIYNAWANRSVREFSKHGCISKRGAAVVGQNLYFVGEDGIWQWDGRVLTSVSKGLQDDIDTLTLTDCAALEYKGELWIAFPTNAVTLKADPDTFRTDNHGNGRLSFYKFTNYRADGWLYCRGDTDLGYLLGWANHDPPLIVRADTDTVDRITSTASVDWAFRSKNLTFEDEHSVKQFRRFKPVLADMPSAATATDTKCMYQFTFISKDNFGSNTALATVTVSACSNGIFETDLSLPHTMDGKRLSVYMRHSATATAKLYGFSVGVRRRWF